MPRVSRAPRATGVFLIASVPAQFLVVFSTLTEHAVRTHLQGSQVKFLSVAGRKARPSRLYPRDPGKSYNTARHEQSRTAKSPIITKNNTSEHDLLTTSIMEYHLRRCVVCTRPLGAVMIVRESAAIYMLCCDIITGLSQTHTRCLSHQHVQCVIDKSLSRFYLPPPPLCFSHCERVISTF